jgi:alpha-1,6-mannosyl-glycoprotein beta-1,2-N-acetylglucosaminyltransferase
MSRVVYKKVRQHAKKFCEFDDYNWDWSIVHLQGLGLLPHTMLFPSRRQVLHIGTSEGMHFKKPNQRKKDLENEKLDTRFKGTKFHGSVHINRRKHNGHGGWGHPKDQAHCLKTLKS